MSIDGDREVILSVVPSGRLLEFDSGSITAFSWSPDGRFIATASSDYHVRIWRLESGRVLQTLPVIQQVHVNQLLWSPDSSRLALIFNSEDDLWLWTLASDRLQRQRIRGVRGAAWSLSGEFIHAVQAGDRGLRWSMDTNELEVVQSTFFHDVTSFQRSPVEDLFAMVSPSSPELRLLTSFSDMRTFQLEAPMTGVTWSSDGRTLAVFGEATSNIELISLQQARRTRVLQGHLDSVRSCEFSADGQFLVSTGSDDTIRVWRCDTLQAVAQHSCAIGSNSSAVKLHPTQPKLATLAEDRRALHLMELVPREQVKPPQPTIRHISAKVVLVGEARVGKTCLALRIAEDRYEERESTHGIHFWPMPPEQLAPGAVAPSGERREVVLWDLGGQEEYRLVHQLFLHDTTLALVLLDPIQGRAAFDAVEIWNRRFEKQVHGRRVVKILVGTKQDTNSPVDRLGIEALVKRCGFAGYFPTSARTGRGLHELKWAIARALDWTSLAATSRPDLFQRIQDEIDLRRQRGEIVLPVADLEQSIQQQSPAGFDPRAVTEVVRQLALQGVIALTRLSTGDQMLVLQLGEVERYAGSIILAARDNPLGVPAIEQAVIASRKWEPPRIPASARLPLREERWVLECVVELLIEHGICVQHEGLLVFPTLFHTSESAVGYMPGVAAASYDFSGAIDNIYSSLIAALALSRRFGQMRLWEDRAEFEDIGRGVCGLHRLDRAGGTTRLDLYFSGETSRETASLFKRLVEDHLRRQGAWTSQHEAASMAGEPDPELDNRARHLRTIIAEHRKNALQLARRLVEDQAGSSVTDEPLRILHLSDLHMKAGADVEELLQPLIADLRDAREGLGLRRLDYLVLSGDLTNCASPEEFEQARRFVSRLIELFGLTAQRCVIVPGNHDLNWDEENLYEFRTRRQVKLEQLKLGRYTEKESWVLVRNEERYPQRLLNFSKFFYHPLMQQEYPLSFQEQGLVSTFLDSRLQFLALNSAWEIDEHFPHRASINSGALSRALVQADEQLALANTEVELSSEQLWLRMAVWHHPVTGIDMMVDDSFLERLRKADVRLCLHGHVHEDRADVVHYLHPTRKLYVVGAGSFGAQANHRPESTPRLYNLVEVARTHDRVRVHTRCRRKRDGAWEGWAVWPGASPTERRTYYDITDVVPVSAK